MFELMKAKPKQDPAAYLARLMKSAGRLLLLSDRELARYAKMSPKTYARHRSEGIVEMTVTDWASVCRSTGIDLDGKQLEDRAFASLHLKRVLESTDFRCSATTAKRFSKLMWRRLSKGLENAYQFQFLSFRYEALTGCNLRGADFTLCDGRNSYMDGSDLASAYFGWADLRGASLRGANLSGAHLPWALLNGADLSAADLESADLYCAVYDENTRLPFGRAEAERRGMNFISSVTWANRESFAKEQGTFEKVELRSSERGAIRRIALMKEALKRVKTGTDSED